MLHSFKKNANEKKKSSNPFSHILEALEDVLLLQYYYGQKGEGGAYGWFNEGGRVEVKR